MLSPLLLPVLAVLPVLLVDVLVELELELEFEPEVEDVLGVFETVLWVVVATEETDEMFIS